MNTNNEPNDRTNVHNDRTNVHNANANNANSNEMAPRERVRETPEEKVMRLAREAQREEERKRMIENSRAKAVWSREFRITIKPEEQKKEEQEKEARLARGAQIEAERKKMIENSRAKAVLSREFRITIKPEEPEPEVEETPEERAEREEYEASKAVEREQHVERLRLTGLATAYMKYIDALSIRLENEVKADRSLDGFMKEAIREEVNTTKIAVAGATWMQDHCIPRGYCVIDGFFQPKGGFPNGIIPILRKKDTKIIFTGGAVPAVKKGRTLIVEDI